MAHGYLSNNQSSAAKKIRSFDWKASAIGGEANWPRELQTALAICLGSSLPMLMTWGPDFIVFHNDAWQEIAANNRSLIGMKGKEAWPYDWPKIHTTLQEIFSTHHPIQTEDSIFPLRQRNLFTNKASLSLVPIFNNNGTAIGVFATVTQIHVPEDSSDHRKRFLAESEEQFRNMADHVPAMIWVTNTEGYCTYVNHRWYEFTGQSREEPLGHGWMAMVHPDDRKHSFEAYVAANKNREPFRLDFRIKHVDGEYRWIIGAAAPRYDEGGEFIGYIGSIIDITDRKQTENERESFLSVLRDLNENLESKVAERTAELSRANEQLIAEAKQREAAEEALRQSQKMETIGQLTGGIAHDFNNILTIIIGNLEALQRRMDKADTSVPAFKRLSENAFQGAQRAAALTQRLLAFSRRQPLDPKPVDINKLIVGMTDILRRTLCEEISIETTLAKELWRAHADLHQLENSILNLAVNARDAMPIGGKLKIETANVSLNESNILLQKDITPGQYVVIAISDTGIGMTKDVLEKAFEPFFTTKDVGQGTGLGLSQVYGFIKQSGGHVKIYSETHVGTCVKIYLPRFLGESTDHDTGDVKEERCSLSFGNSSETILVVEDEKDVRTHTTEILRELGYNVIEAGTGREALDVLDKNRGASLLFTDVRLPGGMNGRQLADEAKKHWPNMKVLFTTGYDRNAIAHDGKLDPNVHLITKPFSYANLSLKLRDLLDADAKSSRILIVEDEILVRMVAVNELRELGYQVEEASTATEALDKIRHSGLEINAAIVDLGLPDCKGVALVAELRDLNPNLPIIIASGYNKTALQDYFTEQKQLVFLEKPYLTNQLVEALTSLGVRVEGSLSKKTC
ncbi:MAG: response regulator [Alphaproteobacteria bacterium]